MRVSVKINLKRSPEVNEIGVCGSVNVAWLFAQGIYYLQPDLAFARFRGLMLSDASGVDI